MPEGDLTKTAATEATFKVGDETYTVKPPTISDMAAFQSHIKAERLKAFNLATPDMDPKDRIAMQMEILKTPITQDDINAEGNTLAGMQYIMYRCLKHNKGVTLESMDEIVTSANMAEVDMLVGSLGGAVENPPEAIPKKKTTKAKAKTTTKA